MRAPPSDERERRPAQPTLSSPLSHDAKVEPILAEGRTGGEITSEIGELLRLWIGTQMERVDDLVAEAEAKTAAIPDLRTLREIVGEWVVLTYSLQAEVTDLKAEVRSLKARLE